MYGRTVLSLATALLVSSAGFAGDLDQPLGDCIGSCNDSQVDHGSCMYDQGQDVFDKGHHSHCCSQCVWICQRQSVSMTQCITVVGPCGSTYMSQSIHIGGGCSRPPHGGCDDPQPVQSGPGSHPDHGNDCGCSHGVGITNQSSMVLAAHSAQPCGTSITMMACQSRVVR